MTSIMARATSLRPAIVRSTDSGLANAVPTTT